MYHSESAMTHATSATTNSSTTASLPATDSAPATTSVGIAGIGKPICSTSTLMKTTSTPYSVIS